MTAFSNGSEFDCWATNWCHKCVHDESGEGPEGRYCMILSETILTNEVPAEWSQGADNLRNRYNCNSFEGVS